ncbi:solute carrier family 13 (sodium-dependent dicarboxylate transporter), member 2/3/5 [Desulfomicrobium apsheronum]|uniref:Solute carrier family 13 (Sodium-dependent dicarboxylate transporter), member 2/3/5 n=1 Tax=Desulfomicrobium apsheronum TaxID=52560 RepID=A0A1I3Q6V3_9BACT|nr:SLC13 family permease [Desulfomicrobium apsheronum]SFJ29763.1 solute carrier family 13 (sodium-dependent dicarboxylate transporter), member 2/3/5 [Desulfomicrobium apsheronum]
MAELEDKAPQPLKIILAKGATALVLGLLIMLLPTPENLTPEGHRLLALLVTVVFLWVSEAVPIGTTALFAGAALILLNITNAAKAWAPFASPAVMFVLMIIMFGVVLNEVGLASRIMYYLLRFAGTKVKRLSLILALGCTITSSVFHDATITVIMVFAFVPVFMSMGLRPGEGHRLPMFFMLLIPLAASAGGFGTLLGGGRNPLAMEILQKFSGGQLKIGFLEYIIIQFPICIITAVATWAILWMLMRPKEKELTGVNLPDPGPMSSAERGVLIIFIITFVLWFAGDLTGWHYSVPAALAILGFCTPGWISFRTICDKFPWESWIVFGAGVSLGVAMLDSGAGRYLAEVLLPLLDGQNQFVVYFGMGFFGSFLSSMMSNSAAVALMLPITLPMAEMMNMAPQTVAMLAPMTTSFIMLVIGCPPTIIAYSTGYFSQVQFMKVAVPWCIALLLVCVLSMMVYWPLIGFTG